MPNLALAVMVKGLPRAGVAGFEEATTYAPPNRKVSTSNTALAVPERALTQQVMPGGFEAVNVALATPLTSVVTRTAPIPFWKVPQASLEKETDSPTAGAPVDVRN